MSDKTVQLKESNKLSFISSPVIMRQNHEHSRVCPSGRQSPTSKVFQSLVISVIDSLRPISSLVADLGRQGESPSQRYQPLPLAKMTITSLGINGSKPVSLSLTYVYTISHKHSGNTRESLESIQNIEVTSKIYFNITRLCEIITSFYSFSHKPCLSNMDA